MKTIKTTLILLLYVLITLQAYAQEFDWAVSLVSNVSNYGTEITTDISGNSYVIGRISGTTEFGDITVYHSTPAVFVAKMDANAEWEWVVLVEGSSWLHSPNSISIDDEGNVYITGGYEEEAVFGNTTLTGYGMFVAKLNNEGEWQWAIDGEGWNSSISTDGNGNSYVTGQFMSSAEFGSTILTSSGNPDVFIAKINSLGEWQWAVASESSSGARGEGISIDNNGNSYVSGFFSDSKDFGSTTLTSAGSIDVFVAKVSSTGQWEWAVSAGGVEDDNALDVAVDNDGNTFVTGYFEQTADFGTTTLTSSGTRDVFVAKLDYLGQWEWAIRAGGPSANDQGSSIVVDEDGAAYLTGYYSYSADFGGILFSDGSRNIFIAKVASNGEWEWVVSTIGDDIGVGEAISTDESGSYFVTGHFNGSINFGEEQFNSNGNNSAFVAKVSFCPVEADFTFSQQGFEASFFNSSTEAENYYWDFGDGNTSTEVNPSRTYAEPGVYMVCLTASDECEDEVCYPVVVEGSDQPICLVTVAEEGDHNVVVWEKGSNLANVDSFFIYREITTGNYLKVGAVHVDSLSQFHDFDANPNAMGYRYKISVLYDTGFESDQSFYHNTMHLQYLGNGNFNWSHYTVQGSNDLVASYNFYRDNNATGDWEPIEVVPGTQTTFTDLQYTIYPDALYYVDVIWVNETEDMCVSTRAVSHNTSRSNVRGLSNTEDECFDPTFIYLASLGSEFAQVGWSSTATNWNIKWGVNGFDFNSEGTQLQTNNNPHLLMGLEENTTYDIYVQAVCGTELSDWTEVFTFSTSGVGIHEFTEAAVKLFPNPTSGQLEIMLESGQIQNGSIRFFDISGKLLFTKSFIGDRASVDLNSFASGIYFMELESEKATVRKKIVKQ